MRGKNKTFLRSSVNSTSVTRQTCATPCDERLRTDITHGATNERTFVNYLPSQSMWWPARIRAQANPLTWQKGNLHSVSPNKQDARCASKESLQLSVRYSSRQSLCCESHFSLRANNVWQPVQELSVMPESGVRGAAGCKRGGGTRHRLLTEQLQRWGQSWIGSWNSPTNPQATAPPSTNYQNTKLFLDLFETASATLNGNSATRRPLIGMTWWCVTAGEKCFG